MQMKRYRIRNLVLIIPNRIGLGVCSAMQYHTPNLNPTLTFRDGSGGGFEDKILREWSGLKGISATSVPFRGAPDITTEHKLITIDDDDEEDDRDRDRSISPLEISIGRSKKATTLRFCPDKLGELCGAMLVETYCKTLRGIKTGSSYNSRR